MKSPVGLIEVESWRAGRSSNFSTLSGRDILDEVTLESGPFFMYVMAVYSHNPGVGVGVAELWVNSEVLDRVRVIDNLVGNFCQDASHPLRA